jgi:hypothetical protein
MAKDLLNLRLKGWNDLVRENTAQKARRGVVSKLRLPILSEE